MAGKRKNFLDYSAASAFVIALGLTSMQDWIAYAKGKDAQGRLRPANIPSNPWTVYKEELLEQGKKFNINEFIGNKLPRKARAKKNADATPTTKKRNTKADAKAEAVVADVPMTPFEIAKAAIQEMKLPNRNAFYELKRQNLLPVGVPRNPDSQFTNEWKGWGDFLGNGNTQVATKPVEAQSTF